MAQYPTPTRASLVRASELASTVFLHATCVLVGSIDIATSHRLSMIGNGAVIGLIVWSVLRLSRLRIGIRWMAADLAIVQCYLVATVSADAPMAVTRSLSDRKIVAAIVISVAFSQRAIIAAAAGVLTLLVLYYANRHSAGLTPLTYATNATIAYLLVQSAGAMLLRHMVMRAAELHDRSLIAANAARAEAETAAAQRRYEREQWALLHDTAASTLMMVGRGVVADSERIAGQARRDLDVLEAGVPVPDGAPGDLDLVADLVAVSAQCRTPVTVVGCPSLSVRLDIAHAVTAATREALTNADRHAEASEIKLMVEQRRVTVTDNGSGFAEARVEDRHGVRRSIVGRLRGIGGDAVVRSRPGRGTEVTMTWPMAMPVTAASAADVQATAAGVRRLVDNLVYVMVSYIGVDLVLQNLQIPGDLAPSRPVDLLLIGIVVVGMGFAVAVPERSELVTAALMAAVVTGSVALGLLLPADQVLGTGNWAIGASGWCIVALGLRHRRRLTVVGLSVWWIATCIVAVFCADDTDVGRILGFHTAAVFFLQLITAWFGASLDRVVHRAQDTNRAYAEALAATAVDRTLNQQCRTRYRELFESFAPLLRGLADRSWSPHDTQVRAAARTEYARLRRLLTQADGYEHPLVADLLPELRATEARGATVSVEVTAAPRAPAADVRAHIMSTARTLLQRDVRRVRIVVTDDADSSTFSILVTGAELRDGELPTLHTDSVRTDIAVTDDLLWLRLHYSPIPEGPTAWSESSSSMTIR